MGVHTSISELQGLRKEEDPKLDARLATRKGCPLKTMKTERIREGKRRCADSSGGKVLTA